MTGEPDGPPTSAGLPICPKLGQHNAEIYGALGLTPADLAAMRAKGVV